MTRNRWTPLHAQVQRELRSRSLIPAQARVLVAVSGGQDSLCLMAMLLALQPKWGWELAIAHCNHRWREDADANADYVAQLAQDWHVPFFVQVAAETPRSEAMARAWRYQVLAELAAAGNYTRVVTGHTQSDRAETMLFNLMRGSGTDGLQSLGWQRSLVAGIELVRPLLGVTRSQTGEFCQEMGLRVWEDSTNQDLHYARNRIRQELIPYLQTHFNPQVEQALAQAAELLSGDVEYLEQLAEAALREAIPVPGGVANELDQWRLHRLKVKALPLAMQRRVVRLFLQKLIPTALGFEQVEQVVNLLGAPNRSQSQPLAGGAIVRVAGEWLVLRSP
jgi:tRNA(Ile)-lysidine synthase